ncbi:MAG: DUF3237 family protein [Longimicrobiales bacterium]
MQLIHLADVELRYATLQALDYGSGGQLYGTMDGTLQGAELRGSLHLTNLALRRPDNINLPALRGLLITDDGVQVYVELNGIATLRPSDRARVFSTSITFRTGDQAYRWLNNTFGVVEGVLDTVGVGGVARGRVYRCVVTLGDSGPEPIREPGTPPL